MSDAPKPCIGTIVWTDITVNDAEQLRDFYQQVVGWQSSGVPVGDYEDYSMTSPETEEFSVGICHAKGPNQGMPPQWLIYILVQNLDNSIEACKRMGGKVIAGPREVGADRFCVIQDPAGAVAGLYQKGS